MRELHARSWEESTRCPTGSLWVASLLGAAAAFAAGPTGCYDGYACESSAECFEGQTCVANECVPDEDGTSVPRDGASDGSPRDASDSDGDTAPRSDGPVESDGEYDAREDDPPECYGAGFGPPPHAGPQEEFEADFNGLDDEPRNGAIDEYVCRVESESGYSALGVLSVGSEGVWVGGTSSPARSARTGVARRYPLSPLSESHPAEAYDSTPLGSVAALERFRPVSRGRKSHLAVAGRGSSGRDSVAKICTRREGGSAWECDALEQEISGVSSRGQTAVAAEWTDLAVRGTGVFGVGRLRNRSGDQELGEEDGFFATGSRGDLPSVDPAALHVLGACGDGHFTSIDVSDNNVYLGGFLTEGLSQASRGCDRGTDEEPLIMELGSEGGPDRVLNPKGAHVLTDTGTGSGYESGRIFDVVWDPAKSVLYAVGRFVDEEADRKGEPVLVRLGGNDLADVSMVSLSFAVTSGSVPGAATAVDLHPEEGVVVGVTSHWTSVDGEGMQGSNYATVVHLTDFDVSGPSNPPSWNLPLVEDDLTWLRDVAVTEAGRIFAVGQTWPGDGSIGESTGFLWHVHRPHGGG